MVNPDHNGGQFEYQWQTGGGRPGKTDAALLDELIDHNVLWFSWAYGVTPDTPTAKFSDLRKSKTMLLSRGRSCRVAWPVLKHQCCSQARATAFRFYLVRLGRLAVADAGQCRGVGQGAARGSGRECDARPRSCARVGRHGVGEPAAG